jgi:tritrans,polycis-undecaprenyl-diphosphate synthase [geranylgeranyl-diphosphate specific]
LSPWRFFVSFAKWIMSSSIVYGLYERMLWNQIKDGPIPEHIGVILDGNRRWASKFDMPSWGGHKFGADKVDDLVGWCLDLKVKTVTLYAFSTENFNRPGPEVDELMRLFDEKLKSIPADERIRTNKVHVRVIGRLNQLPESTQRLARAVEELTRDYDQHYLNVALAYGGRAEIVDATRQIAADAKAGKIDVDKIDEAMIEEHLYTAHLPNSEPDLIIRTSGEERLSGFLLWQGAYSELCFTDVFWPDFRRIDLWRAIRIYQRRERRHGG